jgi:hypothetical protein
MQSDLFAESCSAQQQLAEGVCLLSGQAME